MVALCASASSLGGCGDDTTSSGRDAGETPRDASHDGALPDATVPVTPGEAPRLFVPHAGFEADGRVDWQRVAPFWFGRVGTHDNAIDGRIVWTDEGLLVRAAVYDRQIWDEAGPDDGLSEWDSLTLLLDLDGEDDAKGAIDARSLRIDAQARRHGTDRATVRRGERGVWVPVGIEPGELSDRRDPDAVLLERGYRGGERDDSRGWHVSFFVGWRALGLTGPPTEGERVLRFAMRAFDRDDASGTRRGAEQTLPLGLAADAPPSAWGRIELVPAAILSWAESGAGAGRSATAYTIGSPDLPFRPGTEREISIREGAMLGDVVVTVENAAVGASERLCSDDDDYNFGEGPDSFGGNVGRMYFHVQQQADYADWPCFARAHIRFPLDAVPPGTIVVSARLVMHHKQPTSGGDEGERSLIHVVHVGNTLRGRDVPWTEDDLAWNDAPLPIENLAGAWGDRTGVTETGWDDLPEWRWDVTRAVRRALADGAVSFALQSTDSEYHTGKEFVRSEDFPDWGDPTQRPRLDLVVADPP
ncbi:MAG: DNRLRE domain-containing protein [Sandaracinaceae bacterium]